MGDIRIEGLDPLMERINSLISLKHLVAAMRAGALHVKGKIAIYPPSTQANSPTQDRWYQRGYGPRWKRKNGSIGGSKTSETLGRRWTTEQRDGGLTQIVGNNVSYGVYVQGEEQAGFHAERGWLTTDDVLDREMDTVIGFVKTYLEKSLSGSGG